MNNAPFGKIIDNVSRRSDIHFLNNMEKARKLGKKPYCIDYQVLDGDVNQQQNKIKGQQ